MLLWNLRQIMREKKESTHSIKKTLLLVCLALIALGGIFALSYTVLPAALSVSYSAIVASSTEPFRPLIPPLDTLAYDTKLLEIAHVATSTPFYAYYLSTSTPTSTPSLSLPWPTHAIYPRDSRALLPFNRIVAYYGNFYSKFMGVLGQYPPEEMMVRLASTTALWQAADPATPVIPAIDYIALVAQAGAGADGKYRARMPDDQLQKALDLANQVNGLLFLDIQVGLSDLKTEVPLLDKYLRQPNVELSIDPEFAMQASGRPPGRVIGTFNAEEINWTAQYLAGLVQLYNLPPKILVIHRFTEDMVTGYKQIKPLPEVQVVVDMDGWGDQAKKINTYSYIVAAEPIQFTGFKLFYKNDLLPPSTGLLTPKQVLDLTPSPAYIQYQ